MSGRSRDGGARSFVRFLVAAVVGVVIGLGVLLGTASSASAHVDLVSTDPQNVSSVAGPISKVRFEFSGAADPIVDDFLIENSAGASLPIASVGRDGDDTIVVTAASPLPAGRTKVTWALRGADGHKMSGTISFTVGGTPSSGASSASGAASTPTTTVTGATASGTPTASGGTVLPSGDDDGSESTDLGIVATAGRWLVYAAILFLVGAFAYLVLVHRGTRREGRRIVFLIRRGALVVMLGAIVEWFAQLVDRGSGRVGDVLAPDAWGELLSSGFALGTLLRIVGAFLVLRFVSMEVVAEDAVDVAELDRLDDLDLIGGLAPVGAAAVVDTMPRTGSPARVRIESGPLAFVGVVLLVISESFIGHTASAEPRALVLVSDVVHMTAAGIWVAGVWLLAWTLWQRRRRGEPLDARLLALRFSVVATWALVAVALSGTALAWAILGSPSSLWSTEFGRILVVKVALVAVLAAIGLHNRRTLIPHLEADGGGDRFRRTIIAEAGLFVGVLLLTSLLVVANPSS